MTFFVDLGGEQVSFALTPDGLQMHVSDVGTFHNLRGMLDNPNVDEDIKRAIREASAYFGVVV